jgi:hypothetical protein
VIGYHADVDSEAAAEVPGVVEVLEAMTGEANVVVEAVGVDGDDLGRIGEGLDELGLRGSDEDVVRNTPATVRSIRAHRWDGVTTRLLRDTSAPGSVCHRSRTRCSTVADRRSAQCSGSLSARRPGGTVSPAL